MPGPDRAAARGGGPGTFRRKPAEPAADLAYRAGVSTTVRASRTTRPSLLAAALVLSASGVYVGWNVSGIAGVVGLPWTLLLACSLVLPPWGLCLLIAIAVRRGGPVLERLGWLLDVSGWLVGTVISAVVFSTAYSPGSPDAWTVGLFLAYAVPAYVFAALVRALAGPRRYDRVAQVLAATGLTVAALTLALRVVLVLTE